MCGAIFVPPCGLPAIFLLYAVGSRELARFVLRQPFGSGELCLRSGQIGRQRQRLLQWCERLERASQSQQRRAARRESVSASLRPVLSLSVTIDNAIERSPGFSRLAAMYESNAADG